MNLSNNPIDILKEANNQAELNKIIMDELMLGRSIQKQTFKDGVLKIERIDPMNLPDELNDLIGQPRYLPVIINKQQLNINNKP